MSEARVYVVDDDEAMRDSLAWLLTARGHQVEAHASAEAFLAARAGPGAADCAGCLVLDVRMPGLSGLELFERMDGLGLSLPVIFITGHGDVPMAVKALKRGAVDFIEKPFSNLELIERVEATLAADARARAERAGRDAQAARVAGLSPREREVLRQVVAGATNKLIARQLDISVKTVEAHRSRIMQKTGAKSVTELVALAMALGETGGSQTPPA